MAVERWYAETGHGEMAFRPGQWTVKTQNGACVYGAPLTLAQVYAILTKMSMNGNRWLFESEESPSSTGQDAG